MQGDFTRRVVVKISFQKRVTGKQAKQYLQEFMEKATKLQRNGVIIINGRLNRHAGFQTGQFSKVFAAETLKRKKRVTVQQS